MGKMKISTGNEAFMCKSKGTFPMLPMEHSVKPNIIRNSDTSLAGLIQLKRGKNLYT